MSSCAIGVTLQKVSIEKLENCQEKHLYKSEIIFKIHISDLKTDLVCYRKKLNLSDILYMPTCTIFEIDRRF